MIWSVWNYKTKSYDYYQGGAATGTHAGTPPTPMISPEMGMSPEESAWRVPTGARKIGSGTGARGRVATLGGVDSFGLPSYAVPVALGLAALYFWRKR